MGCFNRTVVLAVGKRMSTSVSHTNDTAGNQTVVVQVTCVSSRAQARADHTVVCTVGKLRSSALRTSNHPRNAATVGDLTVVDTALQHKGAVGVVTN